MTHRVYVITNTSNDWRANEEEDFEEQVKEMVGQPEFRSMAAFVTNKLDNDEYEFSSVELQALARTLDQKRLGHKVSASAPSFVRMIKQELVSEYGFTFVPREKTKFARGSMSSAHGSHPFAGAGGGGSGMGSDRSGPTFTSFGGGPGAMGGEYDWDKSDPKNLPMGEAKKKR